MTRMVAGRVCLGDVNRVMLRGQVMAVVALLTLRAIVQARAKAKK
jgi:hypothetical protein